MNCPSRAPLQRRLLFAFALTLTACHASPNVRLTPDATTVGAIPALQRDIDAILAAPALQHSFWGILVRSLASDETLYSLNAGKLFMPASNMKIVTLAAAAERLGWNYRYTTRLLAGRPIDDGVIAGDLIVVGSGDPSIGGRNG